MQHIRIVVLLFLLLIPLSACSKSPETARKELGQMNIDYTEDNFIKYIERGDKVVVDLFLTAGMSPILKGKDSGFQVLFTAAAYGHNEIVKLLIAKGADVNRKDDRGITALMVSLVKYPDVAKTLIKKGADVNAAITKGAGTGRPALAIAVQHSTKEVVEMMLDKGANINTEYTEYSDDGTSYPNTALTAAILRGDLEIIKVLLSKGAKVERIHLAISLNKVEILKTLVSKADNKSDLDRVLTVAKESKLFEAVDILEKAGAKE